MTNTLLRAGTLACALLTSTCLTAPAAAQVGQTTPPEMRSVDANGVDLISGDYAFTFTEAVIGSGEGALALTRTGTNGPGEPVWGNVWLEQSVAGSTVTAKVVLGDRTETFTRSGSSPFAPALGNGATLTGTIGDDYVYTGGDGTVITFGTTLEDLHGNTDFCSHDGAAGACVALALTLVRPNGARLNFDWDVRRQCTGTEVIDCVHAWRLTRVSNNFGYEIAFGYVTDSFSFATGTPDFYVRTGASLANANVSGETPLAVLYDRSTPGVLALTVPGPTTSAGLIWRFTSGSGTFAIRRPGSSSDDISIAYGSGGVTQVVRDGVTTNYSRSLSASLATTTITQVDADDADPVTTVVADVDKVRLVSTTDPLSHTTSFYYDSSDRLNRIVQPEGQEAAYTYDARGNVTQIRLREKGDTGDTGDDITTSATYPCTDSITCNLPATTTDARGNVTNYEWSSSHGGLLSVTLPAPASGLARPQTRYSYTQITAVSGQPVYQLTGISACAAGSTASPTCVGTADESRTVIGYDNVNVRPTSVESRSGNTSGAGALSAAIAYAYNPYGDVTSIDGPIDNDIVHLRYDSARRPVGTISPDPDGPASGGEHLLKRRAQRVVYRDDGQVSAVDTGTVEGTSDSDWAAFATLESVQTDYDSHSRPNVQRLVAGSTIYALGQTSYDSLGRPNCVAQRMNPSEFASLPGDACTLDTQGDFGPDRITRSFYSLAGQVTQVRTGYGVSGLTANELTATYTDNGRVETVTDAEGNTTTYTYDDHDRLRRTVMPSATQGAGTSNSSDYEELSYDAGGNVTSRRLRDGDSIGFAYDNLNRLIEKDPPGSEATVTYAYDNFGRATAIAQASLSRTLGFAYDSLGRNVSQSSYLGTISYGYDLAGRRTSMSWPGGALTVAYGYSYAGDLVDIRETAPGSNVQLASYGLDDRGRYTVAMRGSGAETHYAYDGGSPWLTGISQDMSGTANDVVTSFSRNPAGQIVGMTRDNTAYSFVHGENAGFADTLDGLNRIATSGFSHDARGNISAIPSGRSATSGAQSYGYDSENRMTSGDGDSFGYDPAGRLDYSTGDPQLTRFLYDGAAIVGEHDYSLGVLRRFVPGADGQPLVWYEGSGTSTRRYFHADERGSVVAVSDNDGARYGGPNLYDEYGVPQGSRVGRFGFAGTPWLPELGMSYNLNRIYNPTLGRFMQTDPIGLDGGMNLYAYVLNDPVNLTDPSGLAGAQDITIIGRKRPQDPSPMPSSAFMNFVRELLGGGLESPSSQPDIIVRGRRLPPEEPDSPPAPTVRPFVQNLSAGEPRRLCFTLRQRRENHDQYVAREAQRLRALGFQVATEVSIRVWARGYPTSIMARADIIARAPGTRYYIIHEIKTGNATLSRNQTIVYGALVGFVAGANALSIGLRPGDQIDLSDVAIIRCPGL